VAVGVVVHLQTHQAEAVVLVAVVVMQLMRLEAQEIHLAQHPHKEIAVETR
jgi:hypothetical protein